MADQTLPSQLWPPSNCSEQLQSVTNFVILHACKMGNFFYLKVLVGCAEARK